MATIQDLTIADTEKFYNKHKVTVQSVMMNLMECPPTQLAELVALVKQKSDDAFTIDNAKALTLTEAVQILGGADPLESTN